MWTTEMMGGVVGGETVVNLLGELKIPDAHDAIFLGERKKA